MNFKMNTYLGDTSNTSIPGYFKGSALNYGNFSTNNSNETGSDLDSPALATSRAIIVGLILGAFILFAIIGNILVILSVACNRHLRIPTNYFIVNLAIADLLLSFTVLPFSATLEVLGYWVLGRIFCDIWAAVDVLCCTASILSLCAISIDRYIGVRYSLQYPTLVTRRRAILALLGVWVLSMVISIGPLLGWKEPAPQDDRECRITEEPFYALFSSLGSFYIPLIVILVMYCRVYIVAKRTTRNLEAGVMKEMSNSKELTLRIHYKHVHEESLNNTKSKGHNPRNSLAFKLLKFSREKKAAKTLGIVVGMFILCWLPFFIVLPLGSLFSALKPPETIFKVIFWLGYFNSCLNPIIYPCSSKEFKRAFIQILRCQCHRRKQLGWWPYSYRNWNRCSLEHARRDSLEDSGSFLSGSQRTLSSASPSPGYVSRISQPQLELCTLHECRNCSSLLSPAREGGGQQGHCQLFTFQLLPERNGHGPRGSGHEPPGTP
ncbi:alpha-1B adrenergic receptor [Lonchura striata]|uniref:Alpha-1B adrenergic receptor n=1 Tax=Lonchura striata TaxID=40157 RepID=A0A218UEU2_9PASE|nr:alpha-1B adrenergic receptor [Lonchura striata domestica]OWK52249.1 Alpha-1B adrenergic receptor [Lonchura striata domestica]